MIQRGEIYWAKLPRAYGSTPAGRRPVLVIQSDNFNRSSIQSVVVVILTTNLKVGRYPGNVYLQAKPTGLPEDSIVNVSQIFTLDKTTLESHLCTLNDPMMAKVDEGIKLVLGY